MLGTPAEENGGGKCNLITAGAFKEIDVALMAHPAKYTAPKMRVLANTEYAFSNCYFICVSYFSHLVFAW